MLKSEQRWSIMATISERGAFAGFITTSVYGVIATFLDGLFGGSTSFAADNIFVGSVIAGIVSGVAFGALGGALFAWAVSAAVVMQDEPTRFSASFTGAMIHASPMFIVAISLLAQGSALQAPLYRIVSFVLGFLAFVSFGGWLGSQTVREMSRKIKDA
jgi:hypothetical protein